jgi:hypothetical protein
MEQIKSRVLTTRETNFQAFSTEWASTILLAYILLNNVNRDRTIIFIHHKGRTSWKIRVKQKWKITRSFAATWRPVHCNSSRMTMDTDGSATRTLTPTKISENRDAGGVTKWPFPLEEGNTLSLTYVKHGKQRREKKREKNLPTGTYDGTSS